MTLLIDEGCKISRKYENPIDNVIIDISRYINKTIFRPLNFTPNMITTLSLLSGVVSIWFFIHRSYILCSIFFIIAYILDCADGNYARMYNMVTVFGDYYDHFCDVFKVLLLVLVIIKSKYISVRSKILFFVCFVALAYSCLVHLGCQELMYEVEESHTLDFTKKLCRNKEDIMYTRYFGVGTLMTFIVVYIIICEYV